MNRGLRLCDLKIYSIVGPFEEHLEQVKAMSANTNFDNEVSACGADGENCNFITI